MSLRHSRVSPPPRRHARGSSDHYPVREGGSCPWTRTTTKMLTASHATFTSGRNGSLRCDRFRLADDQPCRLTRDALAFVAVWSKLMPGEASGINHVSLILL